MKQELVQLKAAVYDLMAQKQLIDNDIARITDRIAQLNQLLQANQEKGNTMGENTTPEGASEEVAGTPESTE